MIDDATGGQDEPKKPVVPRRRGLGKGLGAILPSPELADDQGPERDQLIDLPDRSVLDARFEDAMARCAEDGASLAVLVVALDDFSVVNESFGHRVGDDLLHDAAERLSAARRKSDTVARFAGDEFVVVCPYVASSDLACELADRILEDLSRPTTVDGVEHQLSASVGVVVTSPGEIPGGAPSLETLLGDASLAMGRAKEAGGASWRLFDPSMREHVAARSQNRQDLRAAVEEDGLVLEYEPIVDLETGEAVGDCALLGWRQTGPEVDRSRPVLDLVEEAGLAAAVGQWMLDQALDDLSARHDRSSLPAHFRVWVKVAPSFLADSALVDTIDELIAKHGISPSMLGLDIHEPSAAALASTESTLHELEDRDIGVALDDFGAGPSNLALLQRLPIAGLKLAPALVAGLGGLEPVSSEVTAAPPVPPVTPAAPPVTPAVPADPSVTPAVPAAPSVTPAGPPVTPAAVFPGAGRAGVRRAVHGPPDPEPDSDVDRGGAALVRGLIGLGRALELTIVAQGVVSEAQVMALRALGCEYAQGPFLGHEAVPDAGDEPETESLWAPGTIPTEPGIPGSSTTTP